MPPVDAPADTGAPASGDAGASGVPGAVLTVSGVAVRFGGVSALSDASLAVHPGTVTGLIGPNGAGKTTLFNVISGLQTPDHGTVHLFDTDVTSMKPHHRARLGLARTFQRLEVFGTLSASENIQVGLESGVRWWDWHRLSRLVTRRRRQDAPDPEVLLSGDPADTDTGTSEAGGNTASTGAECQRLLEGVGLAGLGDQQSAAMSTGLARMVELARALAIGPKLLLLDEPGSGLDESESTALGDLLAKLAAGGMAVLLVEHDMELVMRICDHIYVLDFGDIIASGSPDEIRQNPAVQAAYLGEAAPPEGLAGGPPEGLAGGPPEGLAGGPPEGLAGSPAPADPAGSGT